MAAAITFDHLEAKKQALLARISDWPAERLHRSVAVGSWSAAQVVEHLMKTERGIVEAARVRAAEGGHAISLRDRLGVAFIEYVFRSPRRVKVPPSASAVLPGDSVAYPAVLEAWSVSRVQLQDFVETAPPAASRRGIWRHPIGGWMTLPQIMQFFDAHIVHHRFQIDNIDRAIDGHFPPRQAQNT